MSLSKKAIIIFIVKVIALFVSFAISILLARILGVDGFGSYAYIMALIGMLGIPVQLGLPTLVTRLVASFEVTKSWDLMKGIIVVSLKVISIMSLFILLITWFVINFVTGDSMTSTIDNSALLIALFLIPILAILAVVSASLRGLHYVVLSQVFEKVLAPFVFLLMIFGFYLFNDKTTSVKAIFIYKIISSIFVLLLAVYYLWKYIPLNVKKVIPKYDSKNWLNSAIPLFISGGMFFVNSKTDILMLGYYKDSYDVGLYQVASRGGTIMTFSLTVIAAVIAPLIAKLYTQKNYKKLQEIISKGALVTFLLTLPLAIILIFWGDLVLEFAFGNEFVGAYTPLIYLTLGFLFSSMMGSTGLTLNMTGFEKYTAIGVGISAVLNIILNGLLIPKYGIKGAAIATSISLLIWNSILVIFVWRLIKINTTFTGLLFHKKFN